ncbi:TPM domain-containing protein [Sphingobacterium sp. Mn56C]|uniref:TPM domain-containing protein n=1 Tax=Sphingobacterium sp. Mn56C TaxID=3395261 RepID=UPI003BCFB5C5
MAILTVEEQERVAHAVSLAEGQTSGEIRVVVEHIVGKTSAHEKAVQYFNKLKMCNTHLRNGVLIYLAIEDHQFAIIGDVGIHQYVNADFWENTSQKMLPYFKEAAYVDGLVAGIQEAGIQLKNYFPRADDDINELPNEIYFGNN